MRRKCPAQQAAESSFQRFKDLVEQIDAAHYYVAKHARLTGFLAELPLPQQFRHTVLGALLSLPHVGRLRGAR
jgi:hypothetical protein